VTLESARAVYKPERLVDAMRALLLTPPKVDLSHMHSPTVSLERRLAHLRTLLSRRGSFSFEEAVEGGDRMTQAVTLFALLELYKSGELVWRQRETFGEIEIMIADESP
jgi:segregation and condensation protein A